MLIIEVKIWDESAQVNPLMHKPVVYYTNCTDLQPILACLDEHEFKLVDARAGIPRANPFSHE